MQPNTLYTLDSTSPQWLSEFVRVYQTLNTVNLDSLKTVYHQNVVFIDPLHKIEGFDELSKYFEQLYKNLSTCEFVINKVLTQGHEAAIYWTMTYQHNKLNSGQPVNVVGSSFIKSDKGKIIFHRDYLDLGAMLYEQLPFFGRLIKWIKTKALN